MVSSDDPDSKLKFQHNWHMFLVLSNDKSKTGDYVKCVTYEIPPVHVVEGRVVVDYAHVE